MLNGIVEIDGTLYLYENGKTATCGLFEIDGDYYYSYWGGVIQTSGKYYVGTTYCDLPVGNYTLGEDGKALNGFVTKEDGIYYYINGKIGPVGLNYIDGYYYFVNYDGSIVVNQDFYVWRGNELLLETTYTFNELGQIIG